MPTMRGSPSTSMRSWPQWQEAVRQGMGSLLIRGQLRVQAQQSFLPLSWTLRWSRSEIGLAEPGDALVEARGIEHRLVQWQCFADPDRQRGVIGEVIIGQRMDQPGEAR